MSWPGSLADLLREQEALSMEEPPDWNPPPEPYSVGGCFVCFPRGQSGGGAEGDPAWCGAAVIGPEQTVVLASHRGYAGAAYRAGRLALREGPLLEAAVRRLSTAPQILLVNATGRDHPRRAGLALHLGAVLGIPTVGVTDRPLLAEGDWPDESRGAHSPLHLDGEMVGYWLRTRSGKRPLAVHAAWRTRPEVALSVVLTLSGEGARTPEPIRLARQVARELRAGLPTPC